MPFSLKRDVPILGSEGILKLLRIVLPYLPNILFGSVMHLLGLTPQSRFWDLRTTITVVLLRSYLSSSFTRLVTIEGAQAWSTKQREAGPGVQKVDVAIPVVESEGAAVEGIVRRSIEALGNRDIGKHIQDVGVVGLTAEWIGCRTVPLGEDKAAQVMGGGLSEEDKYRDMMNEVEGGEDSGVVLWLHGGAYFLGDPATHRPLALNVAKAVKGRCFLPRYRLAPQDPFPAALIDALVSYLFLLYPTPGAFHSPVPASKIVLAGDSAGAGLSFALTQLLLCLNRASGPTSRGPFTLLWRGEQRPVPLPGGIVSVSAWVDLSRCLGDIELPNGERGSEKECVEWDYLFAPAVTGGFEYQPSPLWPRNVGRSSFYAPDELITHPLVSPMTAESWRGCPPVWVSVGDECLRDSNLYLAHRLLASNVSVRFFKYTSMPHVFQGVLPHLEVSQRSYSDMAEFIRTVFSGGSIKIGNFRIHPKQNAEETVSDEELNLGGLGFKDLIAHMTGVVGEWAEGRKTTKTPGA